MHGCSHMSRLDTRSGGSGGRAGLYVGVCCHRHRVPNAREILCSSLIGFGLQELEPTLSRMTQTVIRRGDFELENVESGAYAARAAVHTHGPGPRAEPDLRPEFVLSNTCISTSLGIDGC